jgi:hypothetical protein
MRSREPIENVVHQGIKRGVSVALENTCFRAALILTMCGIDALAFTSAPDGQADVTRADFVAWAERYIKLDGPLSGLELYAARCGLLHNYGIESQLTRNGVRRVGYFSGLGRPFVRADPVISDTLVMVSVEGFVDAFFRGVDRFLIEVLGDPLRRPVAEGRLRQCVHELQQGEVVRSS